MISEGILEEEDKMGSKEGGRHENYQLLVYRPLITSSPDNATQFSIPSLYGSISTKNSTTKNIYQKLLSIKSLRYIYFLQFYTCRCLKLFLSNNDGFFSETPVYFFSFVLCDQ